MSVQSPILSPAERGPLGQYLWDLRKAANIMGNRRFPWNGTASCLFAAAAASTLPIWKSDSARVARVAVVWSERLLADGVKRISDRVGRTAVAAPDTN